MEWEQLAKMCFADYGSKEQLLGRFEDIRSDMLERIHYDHAQFHVAVPIRRRSSQRNHGELVMREVDMILGWLDWVEAEMAAWPGAHQSEAGDRLYESVIASG